MCVCVKEFLGKLLGSFFFIISIVFFSQSIFLILLSELIFFMCIVFYLAQIGQNISSIYLVFLLSLLSLFKHDILKYISFLLHSTFFFFLLRHHPTPPTFSSLTLLLLAVLTSIYNTLIGWHHILSPTLSYKVVVSRPLHPITSIINLTNYLHPSHLV